MVLCENMSINHSIAASQLKADLLSEHEGDEMTNKIRAMVKHRFDAEFVKIPFYVPGGIAIAFLISCKANSKELDEKYKESIQQVAKNLAETCQPFRIGDIPAGMPCFAVKVFTYLDGAAVLRLASSLVDQIKAGGNRYSMVSATEALVANMAAEAANTLWTEFVHKTRRAGLHPSQITGRKHLRTITREIEGVSNQVLVDLETFTAKLFPREPAAVAMTIWEGNLNSFMMDVRAAHARKANNLARYTVWTLRLNTLVTDLIVQACGLFFNNV